MEERSTLYAYAIIAQPIHTERVKRYMWQKLGKYKQLKHAEKALKTFTSDTVANNIFRIVPYFQGYWWTDEESRKASYIDTNILLWEFLKKHGLVDDARKYILQNESAINKKCFF